MSSYNRRSAKKLGWTPKWFGAESFGEPLQLAVKDFQQGYPDLKVDGLCGPATFRRIKLERDSVDAQPESGDRILIGGKLLHIPWDNVIVPGEDGSLELTKGFRRKKDRYINMVITHWDVCATGFLLLKESLPTSALIGTVLFISSWMLSMKGGTLVCLRLIDRVWV